MNGHKPKGAHGRAAVHALGRTKTTGNFARIEKSKGKGAAIAAYQNALSAHKHEKKMDKHMKHEKTMCKHCKSMEHKTGEHVHMKVSEVAEHGMEHMKHYIGHEEVHHSKVHEKHKALRH